MVSVWPVGLAGGLKFEGPICVGDTVKQWYAYWARDRKFQIDFAGMNNVYILPPFCTFLSLCIQCYSRIVCQLFCVYLHVLYVYIKWIWSCVYCLNVPMIIHHSTEQFIDNL